MSKLFLDPHGDDGPLFFAFTIQRERPHVCVVFDSYIQPARGLAGCDADTRRDESICAAAELLGFSTWTAAEWWRYQTFLGLRDDQHCEDAMLAAVLQKRFPDATEVWAPAWEKDGHGQHNCVALAAALAFGDAVKGRYLTYTRAFGKSRMNSREVAPRSAEEIQRKLRALACFPSQMQPDPRQGTRDWFLGDFREYMVE